MIKKSTTVILQHLVFEICLPRRVPLRSTSQRVSVGKKILQAPSLLWLPTPPFPPKLLESPAFFLARKASSKIPHGFSIDLVATRSTQPKDHKFNLSFPTKYIYIYVIPKNFKGWPLAESDPKHHHHKFSAMFHWLFWILSNCTWHPSDCIKLQLQKRHQISTRWVMLSFTTKTLGGSSVTF